MSAEEIFDEFETQCWSTDTKLELALRYIDNQQSPEAFRDFLAVAAHEENAAAELSQGEQLQEAMLVMAGVENLDLTDLILVAENNICQTTAGRQGLFAYCMEAFGQPNLAHFQDPMDQLKVIASYVAPGLACHAEQSGSTFEAEVENWFSELTNSA